MSKQKDDNWGLVVGSMCVGIVIGAVTFLITEECIKAHKARVEKQETQERQNISIQERDKSFLAYQTKIATWKNAGLRHVSIRRCAMSKFNPNYAPEGYVAMKSDRETKGCDGCGFWRNAMCVQDVGKFMCSGLVRPDRESVIFIKQSTPKQQLSLAKKEIRKRQKELEKAWIAYEKLCDKINKEKKKGVIR